MPLLLRASLLLCPCPHVLLFPTVPMGTPPDLPTSDWISPDCQPLVLFILLTHCLLLFLRTRCTPQFIVGSTSLWSKHWWGPPESIPSSTLTFFMKSLHPQKCNKGREQGWLGWARSKNKAGMECSRLCWRWSTTVSNLSREGEERGMWIQACVKMGRELKGSMEWFVKLKKK